MKTLAICLSLLSYGSTAGADQHYLYRYSASGRTTAVAIKKLGSLIVSDSCDRNRSACLSRVDQWFGKAVIRPHYTGNPAAQYCADNGGINLSLKDRQGNEYGFCDLGDDFLLDAWSLLRLRQ